MTSIAKKEIQMSNKERGATMVEYAIMVALIAVALIVTVQSLSSNVGNTFNKAGSALGSANNGG